MSEKEWAYVRLEPQLLNVVIGSSWFHEARVIKKNTEDITVIGPGCLSRTSQFPVR